MHISGDEKAICIKKPAKISATAEDEVCCFGMVVGLQIRISDGYKAMEVPIPLSIVVDSGTLVDSNTKQEFGTLDQNGKKILGVLQKEISIELFADRSAARSEEAGKRKLGSSSRTKQSALGPPLELLAVLHGPVTLFELVGAFAAKCHLYLQHPRHCSRNVPYRNPHCLSLTDGQTIYTLDLKSSLGCEKRVAFEISADPIDLFATSTEQETLSYTDAPQAIKADLYKHQKQALTFMIQRERGWAMVGPHRDIWKVIYDAPTRVLYHNVVSGVKQTRAPNQFRGGLLIDAPGLGKSLSIIALLASGFQSDSQIQDQIQGQSSLSNASSSTTLLVVPKTLIQMWKDELQKHLRSPDSLKYCVYYGKDRTNYLEQLENYELVITTYSIVRLDWKAWLAGPRDRLTLHSTKWGRVVLDEAHIIREPSKSFSRSVCALEADRRWISTATPIQNRLTDLFSLFKFLRCSPFDDKEVFNAQVTQNWKTRSDPDSVAKLKTLVNCLSIRRPKTTIELPPRINDIAYLDFNTEEWEDYQLVKAKTLYNLDHVRGGDGGTNFLNALKWVNELRLMCNHGPRNPNETHKIEKTPPAWSLQEAQARFDQLDGVGLAKCSNIACCQDLSSALSSETGAEHEDEPWIDESLELWCWLCFKGQGSARTRVFRICNHLPRCSRGQDTQGEEDRISVETDPPAPSSLKVFKKDDRLPTKVKRLLQDLLETPENIKSVIFSSWTKTFDVIQPQLWAKSIRCVRLDGALSANGRANVLRVFRNEPGIRVLLATISCGGIGLDLTAASRAYIMEPQWNPMSESQALDRIYRLGQLKEVTTTRYIMRGSWEEQVLKLQRKKQELSDLTLDGGDIRRADLNYGRLQYLKELVG